MLLAGAPSFAASASDRPFLTDLHLSAEERQAPLAPDLIDASDRIEGIYDPTRIGLLGRSLRMMVRPGTAVMDSIFAERWSIATPDPNVHRRTRYLALAWMWPAEPRCDDFSRFRPHEGSIVFSQLTPGDCARIVHLREGNRSRATIVPVVVVPLSVPVFAAPYAGNRFTEADLRALMAARIAVASQHLMLKRYRPVSTPTPYPAPQETPEVRQR